MPSSQAGSCWQLLAAGSPAAAQALRTVQGRVEFGSHPELISWWLGSPGADPPLGVHFHLWLPPAKDCAAF